VETAAHAGGLTSAQWQALEETGTVPRPLPWPVLAPLLHLDAVKLAGLAQGWTPRPVEVTQWRELRVITTGGDGCTVNAYLVWDEVTREAALFDTGLDASPIRHLIESEQLQLRYIFITHGHEDHVAGLADLRRQFPKARLRRSDPTAPPDQRNRLNDCLALGSLRITLRETPGHAADGVTYLVGNWPEDAPHVAVVGDAIFAGSMGKAPEAAALARQKVIEQILSLPPATLLCPGHGPLTTVAEEKAHNPFF